MGDREPRSEFEEALIAFMLAFWPVVLILGIIDHFFLPAYNLQVPSLAVAALAGWLNVRAQREREEEFDLVEGHR